MRLFYSFDGRSLCPNYLVMRVMASSAQPILRASSHTADCRRTVKPCCSAKPRTIEELIALRCPV